MKTCSPIFVVAAILLLAHAGVEVACGQPAVTGELAPDAPGPETFTGLVLRMPPSVEGLMLLDFAAIDASQSPIQPSLDNWGAKPFQEFKGATDGRAIQHLAERTADIPVSLYANGGANFRAPHGIGVGAYDRILVVRFAKSIAQLRNDAKAGLIEGLTKVGEVELPLAPEGNAGPSLEIFTATSPGRSDSTEDPPASTDTARPDPEKPLPPVQQFVAFPDGVTIIVASKRRMLEELVQRWEHPADAIPAQWAAACRGAKLKSPIVILRKYDAQNERDAFSPYRKGYIGTGTAPIDHIVLTVASLSSLEFELRASTSDASAAEKWLTSVLQSIVNLNGAQWIVEDGGQLVRVNAKGSEKRGPEFVLLLMAFSGPNFAI